MLIRSPLENRISRKDDSLLAKLARQEIDVLAGLARQQAAKERHVTKPGPTPHRVAKPPVRPATPELAEAPANLTATAPARLDKPEMPALANRPDEPAAEKITFAQVLQEAQARLAATPPAEELTQWARLNIQNAPPVVAKLLGLKPPGANSQ